MKALIIPALLLIFILQSHGQPNGKNIFPRFPESASFNKFQSQPSKHPCKAGKLPQNQISLRKSGRVSDMTGVYQKLDSLIIEEMNEETGLTMNSLKDEFYYNNQGLLGSYNESEWDEDQGRWIKSYEETYTYNAAGNCIYMISSYWNSATLKWELYSKSEYSYSPDGQLLLEMAYLWDTGTSVWIIDFKDEYSYQLNEMESIRYLWNPSTGEWEGMYKMKYLFNTEGNLTQSTSYFWDVLTEEWLNLNLIDHYYNPEQLPETIISRFWDEEQEEWNDSSKETFSYGANSDLLIHTYFEWFDFSELWTATGKEEATYNQQYNYQELLVPELFEHNDIYFNHMLTQLSAYEASGSGWNYYGKMKLYYSEINLTGISEPEKLIMAIFPNPVSETITISWPGNTSAATFEIIDCVGQRVYSEIIRKSTPIPISGFPDGMYICRITDNQCIYSEKIIIKKQ